MAKPRYFVLPANELIETCLFFRSHCLTFGTSGLLLYASDVTNIGIPNTTFVQHFDILIQFGQRAASDRLDTSDVPNSGPFDDGLIVNVDAPTLVVLLSLQTNLFDLKIIQIATKNSNQNPDNT